MSSTSSTRLFAGRPRMKVKFTGLLNRENIYSFVFVEDFSSKILLRITIVHAKMFTREMLSSLASHYATDMLFPIS